jgi:adenylosuccinate lyase
LPPNSVAPPVILTPTTWPTRTSTGLTFGNRLVDGGLGLQRSRTTTQIEHYDHLAAFCDGVKRINNILLDLCRDLWTYISMDYFKQTIKTGEIGSSAMPHKVNPIDFENAEGNLGIANAVLEHLSAKLPISRLQRDLTDSTVTRNIGVPLGHTLIALKSLKRGLNKLILNEDALKRDLDSNWAVVAEGIQTVLRREGYPKPYETLLALTRTHATIDEAAIVAFIDTLDVAETVKTGTAGDYAAELYGDSGFLIHAQTLPERIRPCPDWKAGLHCLPGRHSA